MNDIYEKVMLGVFIAALLVVIYAMYDTWYVFDQAGDDSYLQFRPDRVNADTLPDYPITEDMVAWLTLYDTTIDYPVMQGKTNDEYLNKNPYGDYSLSGSIFLDSRNSSDFSDTYSIIYGHHMEYGKMFGALDDYLDSDYLAFHSRGELLVGRDGNTRYELKIFYATTADARDEKVFDTDKSEELVEFLEAQGFDVNDRIICLSTCAGDVSSTRTVVFAYILENE